VLPSSRKFFDKSEANDKPTTTDNETPTQFMYRINLLHALIAKPLLTTVLLLSLFSGYWLGEHRQSFLPLSEILFASILLVSVSWQFKLKRWPTFLVIALCLLTTFSFSWYLGSKILQLTFNDCWHNGERTRAKLADFYQKNRFYPKTLEQLNSKNLPCQLVFPPQLLVYETTPSGYNLSFGDSIVTHMATEKSAFEAHK
jgi:hypothetical protein